MEKIQLGLLVPITLAETALAIFIFQDNRKRLVNRVFSYLIAFAVVWTVSNYFADHVKVVDLTLAWTRVVYASTSVIAALLLYFSLIFPSDVGQVGIRWKVFISIAFSSVCLISFTPLLVSSVTPLTPVGVTVETGMLYPVFVIYFGLMVSCSFYALFRKNKTLKGDEKIQIRYLFAGIFLTVVLASVTNIIVPLITGQWELSRFGPYFIVFFLVLTTYAITKHGLFNIKIIVAELAAASLVLANTVQLFTAQSRNEFLLRLLILALVAFLGYLLVKSVRGEIERRQEVEKLAKERSAALNELEQRNKNLATLQRVSDIVLNESDMMGMTQKILDELPKQLEGCIGGFLSIVKSGQLQAYALSSNQFSQKILSLVGGDLSKYSFPIKRDYNGLHRVLVEKKAVDSEQLADFISPPLSKPVSATIQRLLGAKHIEALPLYAGGEPFGVMMFVFSRSKEEIHERNSAIAKAIADDMSLAIQRAQAFQKLKDANEYLSELDKMKDEFISMASHELNTPLAAIEGYLSMILDEGMGKIDAKTKLYLGRAYESSKRLAELILDLLNVSRIEQGRLKVKFAQVDLGEIAESVIHELQIKADGKKIYLKLDAAKGLPKLWCDPDRIREVIVNLTGNAIKFTDKGGVTISIAPSEGNFVRVSVKDTGRGIAKEDQKKLFQKFSQVKREVDEHQGTGLGLYISKNFVELHNGKLWVESEAGKGAIFSFELPVLKEAPKAVDGAILEKPIDAPQIEVGEKDVPAAITESSKQGA